MCLIVYTVCPDLSFQNLSFQKLKNIMVTFKFAINNTIKTQNHNYTVFGHLIKFKIRRVTLLKRFFFTTETF